MSVRSGQPIPGTTILEIFFEKSQQAILWASARISGPSILPLKQLLIDPTTRCAAIITFASSFKSSCTSKWTTAGLESFELSKLVNSIVIKPVLLICASIRCHFLTVTASTVVTVLEPKLKVAWPSGFNVRQNWPNSIND